MTNPEIIHPQVARYRDARAEANEAEVNARRTAADTAARASDLEERRAEASRRARVDHIERARCTGIIAESSAAEEAATETFAATVADPLASADQLFAAWTEMQSARSVRHFYMKGIARFLSYVNRPGQTPVELPAPVAESFASVLDRVVATRIAAAVAVLRDTGESYVAADKAGADAAAAVK